MNAPHLILTLAALCALPAHADRVGLPTDMPAAYMRECGSCHAAFPPALLSAADWKKTMTGLDKHFGTDASLEAKPAQEIATWLGSHAGKRPDAGGKEPRITASAWFRHEHDELPARVWKDARIKSPANCAACHAGADQGRYGERELNVPSLGRHHEKD